MGNSKCYINLLLKITTVNFIGTREHDFGCLNRQKNCINNYLKQHKCVTKIRNSMQEINHLLVLSFLY